MTTRANQQHLPIKFLGNKKGPTKGFYLGVGKLTQYFCIKPIF